MVKIIGDVCGRPIVVSGKESYHFQKEPFDFFTKSNRLGAWR